MSDNKQYFAARAIEERRLAMASGDHKVRTVHLEMAARYDELSQQEDASEDVQEQRA